jgi:hypothetical protein
MLATPEGDEPLGDKGSIEAMQWDNVGNRPQTLPNEAMKADRVLDDCRSRNCACAIRV